MGNKKILLVDDEIDILDMLGDFLSEHGYHVDTAVDGIDALEKMDKTQYDLLLSDIRMPRMKGFELIREARARFPQVKSALITAYDVNEYIRMARDEDAGNIITKTSPFNFDEVLTVVRNLITEDIFGLERYLRPGAKSDFFEIRHSNQIDDAIKSACDVFADPKVVIKFKRVLREIVTNAVYYGSRNEAGDKKELWDIDVALNPGEYVTVCHGQDDEKQAVSVVDRTGRLKKREVLFWLDRNISRDMEGQPISMYDKHGRGLFISRESIDRFIINIKRGIMTEIIAINFVGELYKGYRPLLITEI